MVDKIEQAENSSISGGKGVDISFTFTGISNIIYIAQVFAVVCLFLSINFQAREYDFQKMVAIE